MPAAGRNGPRLVVLGARLAVRRPPYPPGVRKPTADVVVCGAGIAGVATAYMLTVRMGVDRVVLCDPRPPLTLTSDKSTECYRNFWPSAPMVALMNRSIDLMEEVSAESGDAIGLNRRGYLYVTGDADRLDELRTSAEVAAAHGSGPVRIHAGRAGHPSYRPEPTEGWEGAPDGFDLITDTTLLHDAFHGLSEAAVGALHVRRAGWVSAQQMGAHMLDGARRLGLDVVTREVTEVMRSQGRVSAVRLSDGSTIACGAFVNAAGPLVARVAALHGESVPVHSEVHVKVAARDTLGAMPREAPLMIWADPQRIGWSDEERGYLEGEGRDDLLGEMPAACHGRPEGGVDSPWMLALWEYERVVREPSWPIPVDPLYAEVVLRGMAAMLPRMAGYGERMPHTVVDGGYYTKTVENRPLGGPMETEGVYVAGAMSGFGVMAACGVGDLVARHVTEAELPDHAPAFSPERYQDPSYRAEVAELADTGQI
jgi:sarcosine oxidase, subunit beta